MTLQEAIKSGKRFRRHNMFKGEWYSNPCSHGTFDYADILADDWEIESTPVTITKDQFWGAYEWAKNSYLKHEGFNPDTVVELMAKRLGLI